MTDMNKVDRDINESDSRFNDLFNNWADNYDETVSLSDGEYKEVFINYNEILNETIYNIQKNKGAKVIDIGSGTGNLTKIAFDFGYDVIGIEPNNKMLNIAKTKFPFISFVNGSFLSLPFSENSIDAIITSYAFHHLTDEEKLLAIKLFKDKLKNDGSVIIADTMYYQDSTKTDLIKDAYEKDYFSLANDLETEFYTTHKVFTDLFKSEGFNVSYKQMNKFVWILIANLK